MASGAGVGGSMTCARCTRRVDAPALTDPTLCCDCAVSPTRPTDDGGWMVGDRDIRKPTTVHQHKQRKETR